MKKLIIMSLALMVSLSFFLSCVEGDLYEYDEMEFSDFVIRKKTKQDVTTDVPWYTPPVASYVTNECAAWAMMHVFGLDNNKDLDRVRNALCCSFTANLYGIAFYDYNLYTAICEAGGFYPTNVVEASTFLYNNFGGSFRSLTKHEGYSELGITIGEKKYFENNKFIIITTKSGKGHAGIATEYSKKKGVFKLHYKDRNDNDVLIDLSEVEWVCD